MVAAAKLSHRYITDRFLPDKAIDLMDEAASRLAMERDSVPTEIDEAQRKLTQLELAARQLSEESDESARERLVEVQEEMEARDSWRASASSGKRRKWGWATSSKSGRKWRRSSSSSNNLMRPSKKKLAAGQAVSESEYQRLYELDVKRRQLQSRAEAEEPGPLEEAAEERDGQPHARLLRTEVTPDEIATVVTLGLGFRCRGC